MSHRLLSPRHLLGFVILGVLVLSVGSLAQPAAPVASAAHIDQQVLAALAAAPDGQATFIVYLHDRPDLSAAARMADWVARGQYVMEQLQTSARTSQAGILDRLARRVVPGHVSRYQSFWIANAIVVTGDQAAAEWLAQQPGVAEILSEMKLDAPEPAAATSPDADFTWGIEKIGADQVWSTYSVKGEGMVVGLVDTGVQWDHTALKGQYRGWNGSSANHNYSWWDPANFCGVAGSPPCDNNGHGTHTTGTAAGGTSAAQGPIGVAPGAKWIHAAGCCASNASLLSSLQWMAAPTDLYGNGADPAKRPNVVNNSWGGPGGSQIFYDALTNLRASGIVPVFSAGNNGSACGTLGSPGDNMTAFNVGSTTSSDGISSFSSRGSNPFTGLPDPDVTAPGDNIYSSVPTNSYSIYSGTSMAAPHVTGAVALIMSAEPALVGQVEQVEELLRKTAVKLTSSQTCGGVPGSQVPNSTFGWGRINVKAAVDFIWHAGTLSGTVTDVSTGLPIADATVSITRNSYTLTRVTDAAGQYSFVAGAGTYQVKAEAFGYAAQTVSGVSVSQDATTTQDFALGTLSVGSIYGTVTESGTATPVAGATVALVGSSLTTATAADGTYTLANVPFGSYTARMTSPGFQALSTAVTVDGAETLNFTPATASDYVVGDGGDTCSVAYAWIDATVGGTALNLDDDAYTSVTLPWTFTFYSNNYTALYISSNGFVSFGQGYDRWHGIVPFEGVPNNQIIGMGEDLNPANGSQGIIYTKNLGDGRFVVEYHAVQHWASGNPETFEIILNNNDDTILVQYQTVSWPDFANAGIENSDGSRGILYAYANNPPLTAGLAVKYTPFSGQAPACTPAAAPVIAIRRDGTTAQLSWPHQSPDTSYQVWRDTSPYFFPAGEGTLVDTLLATGSAMTYDDAGRVGDAAVNHFWVLRGVVAGGASGPSNRVGEFDFDLMTGD